MALATVENSPAPRLADAANHLAADLAQAGTEIALFLDDFHVLDASETAGFLDRLLALTPPSFSLVIGSRVTPRLALPALRVAGEVLEIGAAALRFSAVEAAEFMGRVRGLEIAPEQLARLVDRSEGWVAGLQLASLSLSHGAALDATLETFSGAFRDVADYIASDVVARLPESLSDFLLRTAVLNRMCAGICAALTGRSDSQDVLERLEAEQMFLVPLDRERTWYRYHHLFRDFLLAQLGRRLPAEIVRLHARAADWFERADLPVEAVEHALLSGDLGNVCRLIAASAWEEMKHGRMPRVNAWMKRVPPHVRARRPRLLVAECTALYHMNRTDEAEVILRQLEEHVRDAGEDGDVPALGDELRHLRAGIAMARDDGETALRALEGPFGPATDFMLGTIDNIRGYCLASRGDFADALDSLDRSRRHHAATDSDFGVVYCEWHRALVHLARGELQEAIAPFDARREQWRETYVRPVDAIVRGIVHYERGELACAAGLLAPNLAVVEEVGHVALLNLGSIAQARLLAAQGDLDAALALLARAAEFPQTRRSSTAQRRLLEHARARLLFAAGRRPERPGNAPVPNVLALTRWDPAACLAALTAAREALATGRPQAVLKTLRHLRQLAIAGGRRPQVIETLLLEGLAEGARGRDDEAVRAVAEAARLAAPPRLLRWLVDEGEPIRDLLRRAAAHSDAATARFIGAALSRGERSGTRRADGLSERERAILRLLGRGESNAGIAGALAISENTVKWHIKNLFGKLGVPNRTAAVRAAQEHGLLD